jgi:predicted PolB exonuclease-like 3'-5' exonuclease
VPAPEALLVVDIETTPDETLLPADWPNDKFPKIAWHRIVAISFVEADILRDAAGGREAYRFADCRSGGEEGWGEARLLRGFWKRFSSRDYRCVSWNGRSFDIPVLLHRSMLHGVAAPKWFGQGTRWSGYGTRYSGEWHADLMDMMSTYGASSRLTLDEACAMIGLPGKGGEHGSLVSDMVAQGEIGRVRNYCETDVLNTYVVYLRHQHLSGCLDASSHDDAVRGVMDFLRRERTGRPHLGRFLDEWQKPSSQRSAFVGRPGERYAGGVAGAPHAVVLEA